jgi:hypothetical protein
MKMIRSKIAMGFLWALLALALHVVPGPVGPVHAQGTRKDDIVFNSRGIPLAGAMVRVCAMPASGQPCTPLALIYSDAALTQALANPTTTDGLGNYFFYAAPGKYEIEISGPAITTKQIPNVILPNDPASPTFTGAVSAFSLTLSGNLTVNGNTTVVGNLASGTLNLSNQSTPPGSASSGTVNLYTKTADKRLYYKDDTGAEVGPLGAGAQTTAVNTFTASQNMDSGLHIKGPDPYNDMARYGGYFNASPPATTASCTNASTSVTLAAALDFQDASKFPGTSLGNGIVLYQCGAATGLTTPPAPTVTPYGVTGGATTYNYKYVAEDLSGGLTAASPVGTTATGPSALGVTTVNLTAASWNTTLGGEQVYTCSANCTVSVNAPINIAGFTNAHFNGNYTIIATNGTNQFTVFSPINPAPTVTSESAAATASILACNILTMAALSVPNTVENASSDTVLRWWVYRNNVVAFAVQQRDPYYEDCGVNVPATNIPPYVPSSPGSAVNKYLATTIVSGGGTVNIVVANAAGNTISGQTALHDNSQNLLACMTASRFGTPCYVPSAANPPFNAATVFTGTNSGNAHLVFASSVGINQPWVNRAGGLVFEGYRNQTTSFAFNPFINLLGGGNNSYALPTFQNTVLSGGSGSASNPQYGTGINFFNINFQTQSLQGVAFNWDTNSTFGLEMDNVSFSSSGSSSNVNIPPAIIRGITQSRIGRLGDRNSCQAPQIVVGPPCLRFTTVSPAETSSTATIAGSLNINGFNLSGGGASYQFDALPWINSGGSVNSLTGLGPIEIRDGLREIGKGPFLRVNVGSSGTFFNVRDIDDDAPNAQPGNGFIDLAAVSNNTTTLELQNLRSSVTGQALAAGPALIINRGGVTHSGVSIGSVALPTASGQTFIGSGSVSTSGSGGGIQAVGVSTVGYAMPQPNTPTIAVAAHGSCGANCVPAGTYYYAIVANDANGKNSIPSANSVAAVTDGTQSITVNWAPVAGQVTTSRLRGTSATSPGSSTDTIGTGIGGTSYVDSSLIFYSVSPPTSSSANSASLSSIGLATSGITYVNSGFADTIGGTLSANRAQTIPDVTGYIPVTSYMNSGYDNATRSNGSIGSNWTIQQSGLNIASNQIQGATAAQSNSGFWNANTFSPVQFAQATITALNGTTDFPGVTVLASGSGASATYYDCVENSTTIFMQRVVNAGTTNLTSSASSGAVGDLLRLEVAPGGALTCFKNGVSTLTATDTQIGSGSPGLLISGNIATEKNWSGGNLHPLAQLDIEQDWTKTQHFTQGVAFGTETFTASPRAEQNVFLSGALTATWTGTTWTNDKAVTITRIQVQAKTAPAGCATNAIVRFTDGTTPINLTISAAANDSGAISQNYAAGSSLQVLVQTAASGCTTSPADANVTVQYRMQ